MDILTQPFGLDDRADVVRLRDSARCDSRGESIWSTPRFDRVTPRYDPASARSFATPRSSKTSPLSSARTDEVAFVPRVDYPVDPRPRFDYAAAADPGAPVGKASAAPVEEVFSAARHGHYRKVERCIVDGFDPRAVDAYGNTLFHVACQNGSKRIGKLAIKYGGSLHAVNGKGNTGLHFLVAYGFRDLAQYFLSKGADPNMRNCDGRCARDGI